MVESNARIDHYGPKDTLLLRDPILEVYLASHRGQQDNAWYSPDQFWQRLVEFYAPSRDFGLVAAWLGESMIGYAFGSPMQNSAEVWEMTRQALPEMQIPQEPQPIYFFREFAVHPEHQGKGYGRKIHDALLKTRTEQLAHLLVRTDNQAKASYLNWGWLVVGKVQPFDDAPTMDAMIRNLPLDSRL